MELDETSLRQLIKSPHGAACGMAILDGVGHGKLLHVLGADGEKRIYAKPADALQFLLKLGWKADPTTTENYAVIPLESRT